MRWILIITLAYVLGLNSCVRHQGGDANLLSVVRLSEKTQAVVKLGLHMLRHAWSDRCERGPEIVAATAREQGVPVRLALAIARTESSFRPHAISSTGAMGLMQLMPNTAREHGVVDPFDPEDNARGAMRFLDSLSRRYRGNWRRMAAAYNAGPARVPQRGALTGIPAETQAYVKRVIQRGREPLRNPLEVARR